MCNIIDVNDGQINQNSAELTTTKPSAKPSPKPTPKPSIKPAPGPTPKPSIKPTAKPSIKPTPGPTPKPSNKPTAKPTQKPSSGPSQKPTKKPTLQPTKQPTKPPSPKPSSPPTLKPTLSPQDVKWYRISDKECKQGSDYDPAFPGRGWTYETETECCQSWSLNCGEKDEMSEGCFFIGSGVVTYRKFFRIIVRLKTEFFGDI